MLRTTVVPKGHIERKQRHFRDVFAADQPNLPFITVELHADPIAFISAIFRADSVDC